jgi:subtilisin family serine protease
MPKRPSTYLEETGAGLAPIVAPADTPDYVVAELAYESQVSYSARGFQGPAEADSAVRSLNNIIEGIPAAKFDSHFGSSRTSIRNRAVAAPKSLDELKVTERSDFAQSGFVQIVPESGEDAASLVQKLNRSPQVWKAVVAPKPVPAVATGGARGSRNFEPSQGYLHSPPNGIGAIEVWDRTGAKGEGVTICDIEGNWNRSHEDLPRRIRLLGGNLINDIGWRNHGTAVLGEIVSQPNQFGTVGIAHRATAVVQSAVIGGVFNTAGAITNAASRLGPGDVILIELQATGPRNRYVAMQYWDDTYSAILATVARGITVVEAAGNGGENFDHRAYRGSGLQKDSGAIVVGAGVPPTNHFDIDRNYDNIGVPRSRIWFSNYGKIVNVQAWGWHVTTTGYGDAQGGGEDRWYTLRFSGTSSASPIVTGAVACVQGYALAKRGRPLTPDQVRQLLVKTGTPQVAGPGVPLSQHIGPQPNLAAAARKVR